MPLIIVPATHISSLLDLHVQGSGAPGVPEVDPMDQEEDPTDKNDDGDEEKEDVDPTLEDEKRRAGEEEPPAFGVEGDGGDSSVLEAVKEEVSSHWRCEFRSSNRVCT